MIQKKITFDSFIRGILTAMVIIGILYLVNRLSGVLLPFFIAWLIAYLTYPMVIFFQNKLRLRNRVISILVVLLVLLSIITLAFVGLVPPIIEEFGKLKELLTAYFIEGSKQAAIPGTVANFIKEHIDMLKIHEALNESNFANTMRNVLPQVWALLTQSVNIVFSVFTSFIILLYTFFILLDYEAIARGWIKLIPARHREMTVHIVTDVQDGMNKYFRGQAFVAFCVGILFSIGFLIIDFPLAIGFGLFIGLLNMVPYLQLIAFIPTVLLALLKAADTGENFWWILFCAFLVFCIVQIIQDGLIVPKVMGKGPKYPFAFYVALVLSMTVGAMPVLAAGDPLAVINNLSTFIFSLIRAIGLILLGFGVVQVGLSLKSHDPSQRANGFLTLAGGVIITFAKEILDLIVG